MVADTSVDPRTPGVLRRTLVRVRGRRRTNVYVMLWTGAGTLLAIVLVALLADVLAPYDPIAIDASRRLLPPSLSHLLGTDELGRDILSRLIDGSRISLMVGVASVSLGCLPGIAVGLTSGYLGGRFDGVVSRVVDAMFAFPGILLAIALMAIVGPGVPSAIMAIAVITLPLATRVARSAMIAEMNEDYVEASKALGSSTRFIIFRAILPNLSGPLLVLLSLSLAQALLAEAALSFLGLGANPPTPDWGAMLATSRRYLVVAPWYGIAPGVAIFVAVLGVNLLAEGIQGHVASRKGR